MPSLVERTKMIPTSENDVINPGSFYFACLNLQRKTDPDSYWIVLRAPREWLPVGFFDTRPVQTRVFPFWIVGKDQRVWLPRSSLFYLDRSQRDMFRDKKRLEFTNTLILIDSFQNMEGALAHFRRRILESTAQYDERRRRMDQAMVDRRRRRSSSGSRDENAEVEEEIERHAQPITEAAGGVATTATAVAADSSIVEKTKDVRSEHTRDNRSRAKRQRREGTTSTSVSLQSEGRDKPTTPARVKTEKEERQIALAGAITDDSRVRIYVGRSNTEYVADAHVLRRSSPVLHSLVCTNDEFEGKFIMHPKLCDIDTSDFMAVLEFMQNGEYAPAIVSNPDGNDTGPMALGGCITVEDYSEFLVQAGRLYILAKTFSVKGMVEWITRKIIKAQYKNYSNIALIEFARIMLTRPRAEHHGAHAPANGLFTFEFLESWIIAQLAENFMQMMRSEVEHSKYLALIDATKELHVHAIVLEKAASNYRRLGGLPEIIEDSE